jgi:hypothetical protein
MKLRLGKRLVPDWVEALKKLLAPIRWDVKDNLGESALYMLGYWPTSALIIRKFKPDVNLMRMWQHFRDGNETTRRIVREATNEIGAR